MIGSMPTSRGARCPIGKNWTNSMSISDAPARKRQRIAVAAHIGRGAVAAVQPRQPAGRQDRRLGRDGDRRAGVDCQATAPAASPSLHAPDRRSEIAGLADRRHLLATRAQRLRHRRPGIDEIHIDAARPVMARRRGAVMWPSCAPSRRPMHPARECTPAPSSHSSRASVSSHSPRPAARYRQVMVRSSGTSSPSATATVICAITVAPPRPIRLRSASSTWRAAPRAASIAAYMPRRRIRSPARRCRRW